MCLYNEWVHAHSNTQHRNFSYFLRMVVFDKKFNCGKSIYKIKLNIAVVWMRMVFIGSYI